jgi:hypothetical protein
MEHDFLTLISGGGPLCTIQRLQQKFDKLPSSFAFDYNLRRYVKARDIDSRTLREAQQVNHYVVGRCRLTVSKLALKAPMVSA